MLSLYTVILSKLNIINITIDVVFLYTYIYIFFYIKLHQLPSIHLPFACTGQCVPATQPTSLSEGTFLFVLTLV
ncbi:unnamed protein product [Ixodes pacificus]